MVSGKNKQTDLSEIHITVTTADSPRPSGRFIHFLGKLVVAFGTLLTLGCFILGIAMAASLF
jgi:hypothetical protein